MFEDITNVLSNNPLEWGPVKWNELHSRPFKENLNLNVESYWLDHWIRSIPCLKCRKHVEDFRIKRPENLYSREAYGDWTVAIHNDVNMHLGKPYFSACNIWKL